VYGRELSGTAQHGPFTFQSIVAHLNNVISTLCPSRPVNFLARSRPVCWIYTQRDFCNHFFNIILFQTWPLACGTNQCNVKLVGRSDEQWKFCICWLMFDISTRCLQRYFHFIHNSILLHYVRQRVMVMFLPLYVCLSVCLSDYSKSYKFSWNFLRGELWLNKQLMRFWW